MKYELFVRRGVRVGKHGTLLLGRETRRVNGPGPRGSNRGRPCLGGLRLCEGGPPPGIDVRCIARGT